MNRTKTNFELVEIKPYGLKRILFESKTYKEINKYIDENIEKLLTLKYEVRQIQLIKKN